MALVVAVVAIKVVARACAVAGPDGISSRTSLLWSAYSIRSRHPYLSRAPSECVRRKGLWPTSPPADAAAIAIVCTQTGATTTANR